MITSIQYIDESRDFQKFNKHIIFGYRVNFSKVQCLKSIFMITNETVNIWTHLLGSLYFLYSTIDMNCYVLPSFSNSTSVDYFIMTVFCLSYTLCLMLSTLYHVFNCHSEKYYIMWLNNDRLGITLGLLGSYIPSIYYGFYHERLLKIFYTSSILIMIAFIIIYQLTTHRYNRNDAVIVIFYILVAMFGVIPTIHFIMLHGHTHSIVLQFVPRILIMYLLIFSGYCFYHSQLPERLVLGLFDYMGASHQIWHLFVLLSLLWWYSTSVDLIQLQLNYK